MPTATAPRSTRPPRAARPPVPPNVELRPLNQLTQDLKRVRTLATPLNRARRAHALAAEADLAAEARLEERNTAIAVLYYRDGWAKTDLMALAQVEAPLLQKIRRLHKPRSSSDRHIDQLVTLHASPADAARAAGKWIVERREFARQAREVRDEAIREMVTGDGLIHRGAIAQAARDLGLSAARISQILARNDT